MQNRQGMWVQGLALVGAGLSPATENRIRFLKKLFKQRESPEKAQAKTLHRRLQVQERMTQQIARAIDESLNPLGVITVVEAVHYCMIQRGVEQRASTTITTARRGVFLTNQDLETKFQDYLRLRNGNGMM